MLDVGHPHISRWATRLTITERLAASVVPVPSLHERLTNHHGITAGASEVLPADGRASTDGHVAAAAGLIRKNAADRERAPPRSSACRDSVLVYSSIPARSNQPICAPHPMCAHRTRSFGRPVGNTAVARRAHVPELLLFQPSSRSSNKVPYASSSTVITAGNSLVHKASHSRVIGPVERACIDTRSGLLFAGTKQASQGSLSQQVIGSGSA